MALTDSEKQRLLSIETEIQILKAALDKMASKRQLKQLTLVKEREYITLEERVSANEADIAALLSEQT